MKKNNILHKLDKGFTDKLEKLFGGHTQSKPKLKNKKKKIKKIKKKTISLHPTILKEEYIDNEIDTSDFIKDEIKEIKKDEIKEIKKDEIRLVKNEYKEIGDEFKNTEIIKSLLEFNTTLVNQEIMKKKSNQFITIHKNTAKIGIILTIIMSNILTNWFLSFF